LQVGAIITLSRPQEIASGAPVDAQRRQGLFTSRPEAGLSVLGNNLIERTTVTLRKAGIERPTAVRGGLPLSKLSRESSSTLSSLSAEWEKALLGSASRGFDLLLLIGTSAYTELDYSELLRFHAERGAALTQVYTPDGPIDIAVVSTARLCDGNSRLNTLRALMFKRERFSYRGYVNRLRVPADSMQLVEDGLYQRCNLRPTATEVASGLWFADGVKIDHSCVIGSPSFIGANVRVAACCSISGGSAIEGACQIDSGTSIERSWILPGTYVGVGLSVRRSIVSKQKIFHLDRETEVTISDRRLLGATRSLPLFETREGFLSRAQLNG
jgi:carbonic anhydrase/acetyltransferase-like protein (isoleucine patch superfamily)